MPVVLPLVLLAYCEYDVEMKKLGCRLRDFLTDKFIDTGIVDWVIEKQRHTKVIQEQLKSYVKHHAALFSPGKDDWWFLPTTDVVKAEVLNYFKNRDALKGDPKNQKYEALYQALERNKIWGEWSVPKPQPWKNETNLVLFHSTKDEVVPYVNYERALENLRNYYGYRYNAHLVYGHIWTGRIFYLHYEIDVVQKLLSDDHMDNLEEVIGGIIF